MPQSLENNKICKMLGIKYPIIVAPMFLVTNEEMIIEACQAGITAAIPALNYRDTSLFREGVKRLKNEAKGPFGINLIVNKSNFYFKEQLEICCEEKVDFIITSLGSPEETIRQAHAEGILVFCDVTDLKYAQKVEKLGADALIAVNNRAGGHAGKLSSKKLVPMLKKNCQIPIISAGGVGDAEGVAFKMKLGADGLSVGSIFIATKACGVSEEYKQAIVSYGEKDIVMTTKLSGSSCTVINTPYVQKVGTKQNWLERILNKNKRLKKWVKAFTFYRGMKKLNEAAFSTTYKTVWCAGPSIEYVHEISTIPLIVEKLIQGFEN
jgi:nitronate monooxygenase